MVTGSDEDSEFLPFLFLRLSEDFLSGPTFFLVKQEVAN